ncbi:MAG: hypothetical protein PWP12_228 [Bacillota bacterium]|nr:hypothetical protein [Bacillota bacterium]MDK2882019.1 hypothetical protein [Bacillota bacterium]MDK2960044.1 hypothetical protein [Bacillota bacterium]
MRRRTRFWYRAIGLILAVGGAIIFATAIPGWVWTMLLGLLLAGLGGYLFISSI